MMRRFGATAALLGACAVGLGAFGAHALQAKLDPAALHIWHTAVQYQFWHALALLAVAGFAPVRPPPAWPSAAVAFVAGIVLFCGSLYALALGAPRWIGAITPLGGLCLIAGWLLLAGAVWCSAAKE